MSAPGSDGAHPTGGIDGARPFGSMSLRRRVVLVVAAYFLLVGAGQVAALSTRVQVRQLDEQRRELAIAQDAAASLQLALLHEREAVLNFVLTGLGRFRTSYEEGARTETAAIALLQVALRDERDVATRLDTARAAAERWRMDVASPILLAPTVGADGAASAPLVEQGMDRFDAARHEAAVLATAIDRQAAAVQERADAGHDRLTAVMLLASTTAFLLSLVTVWLLRRWITVPILQLSENVRRVAGGDLHHSITPSGPPELSGLGGDVEAMRQRVLCELETAIRAVEALQQSAPLVVGLRSELAVGQDTPCGRVVVATRFAPAEGVLAGDWYDVVELDGDRIVLAIVDISGHGPAAGLFALQIKHLLLPALRLGMDPGEALTWVAQQLGDTGDRFATCLLVELVPSQGYCRYANAGHPPAFLLSGEDVAELSPTGPLLGPLETTWRTTTLPFAPRDLLLAYTDGLIEARDASGEEFGEERLVKLVTAQQDEALDTIADNVLALLHAFSRGRLVDDLTLVLLACKDTSPDGRSPAAAAARSRRPSVRPRPSVDEPPAASRPTRARGGRAPR